MRSRRPTGLGFVIVRPRRERGAARPRAAHSRENHEPLGAITPRTLHRRDPPSVPTQRARCAIGRANTKNAKAFTTIRGQEAVTPQRKVERKKAGTDEQQRREEPRRGGEERRDPPRRGVEVADAFTAQARRPVRQEYSHECGETKGRGGVRVEEDTRHQRAPQRQRGQSARPIARGQSHTIITTTPAKRSPEKIESWMATRSSVTSVAW